MCAPSLPAMALPWCRLLLLTVLLSLNYADRDLSRQYFKVSYGRAMQPLIRIYASGQKLDMVFDSSSGNTLLFVHEDCHHKGCYSYRKAAASGSVRICAENALISCETGSGDKYLCREPYLPTLEHAYAHNDQLVIDGVEYNLEGIEAEEMCDVELTDDAGNEVRLRLLSSAMRLLLGSPVPQNADASLPLFERTSGLFGGSGDSLSCRSSSIWMEILRHEKVGKFSLDFYPPERAQFAFNAEGGIRESLIVLNPQPRNGTVWSQPKQTGDARSNGMYSFVMYHPSVCGVDLLHNVSSNWLTVVDTSGPCLTFPPFLFDRLMAHIPVECPFVIGEPSRGRLCKPRRGSSLTQVVLPSFRFQLADENGISEPPWIEIPLERLVFLDEAGTGDLLCVARSDGDAPLEYSADMMLSHIGFGSLAVAAVYTVIDIVAPHQRVGLMSRGNATIESTTTFCAPQVVCISPMQTYDPPTNQCVDPVCSRYMFMSLDPETKMCVWNTAAPVSLGTMVVALVVLDLFSHRLYKQAIDKASEVSQ